MPGTAWTTTSCPRIRPACEPLVTVAGVVRQPYRPLVLEGRLHIDVVVLSQQHHLTEHIGRFGAEARFDLCGVGECVSPLLARLGAAGQAVSRATFARPILDEVHQRGYAQGDGAHLQSLLEQSENEEG